MKKWLLCAVVCTFAVSGQEAPHGSIDSVLNLISADSMKGNVSFLASDALEGRATPSKGLDVAAEFLASRFRAAGLEPIGAKGSYFQTAKFVQVTPKADDLRVTLVSDGNELKIGKEGASIRALSPVDLTGVPVIDLPESGVVPEVAGKVVAGSLQVYGTEQALLRLQAHKPSLILLVAKRRRGGAGSYLEEADTTNAPVVRLGNEDAFEAVSAGKALTLSVHASAPEKKEFALNNVGGLLRGSDAALQNEYVLVTAHYDHVGTKQGTGDTIFNGANDNASGTASVVEIAGALAKLPVHPRRSILFMALFGEEKGLLGAYYYAKHPLFPLAKTVAALNLEQMGRTDDKEGARVRSFSFTGTSYSDLPARMEEAAKPLDVSVYKKHDADAFFARSDNYAFAVAGVVAHTLVVAYEYPEYHAVGDEWPKLDYVNMAAIDRAVAAGIVRLADDPIAPKWAESKETESYRPASAGK
ncbi:MAG: putative aminopeptidase [Bryobacterales bacterium]|nr:putative aminopeptidase [Bryobacterales bacterium]